MISVAAAVAHGEAVRERHDQEQHELLGVDQAGARLDEKTAETSVSAA